MHAYYLKPICSTKRFNYVSVSFRYFVIHDGVFQLVKKDTSQNNWLEEETGKCSLSNNPVA